MIDQGGSCQNILDGWINYSRNLWDLVLNTLVNCVFQKNMVTGMFGGQILTDPTHKFEYFSLRLRLDR